MFFSWFNPKWPKAILLQVPKILYISRAESYLTHHIKGQTNSKWFFKPMFLPKNERTNSTLLWYLRSTCFCLFFWKKLKTPKRHFQNNWPLLKPGFGRELAQDIQFECWRSEKEIQVFHLMSLSSWTSNSSRVDFKCSIM